jgi:hypothetical protein
MSDPTHRRYSEREVRLILKSAAGLQRRATEDAPASGGMSLAELEQVATEVGIDPSLIRRAAAQLETALPRQERNRFLGRPAEILIERVIDVRLGPEMFDQLLEVVRATTHEVGEVSTVGRQFGWKGRLRGAKTDVSISAGEERTTLRIRVALDEVAVGHFMLKTALFGGGGGLIGAAALASAAGPLAPVVGLAILGTGYGWSRLGFARTADEFRRDATQLIDQLAKRAAEISGPSTLSS